MVRILFSFFAASAAPMAPGPPAYAGQTSRRHEPVTGCIQFQVSRGPTGRQTGVTNHQILFGQHLIHRLHNGLRSERLILFRGHDRFFLHTTAAVFP